MLPLILDSSAAGLYLLYISLILRPGGFQSWLTPCHGTQINDPLARSFSPVLLLMGSGHFPLTSMVYLAKAVSGLTCK